MTTLVAIVQAALRETPGYEVPTSFVGNTNPTAVTCLALANRTGRELATEYLWQVLLVSYTFATVASTANYALPTPFRRIINNTVWDQTNKVQLRGPVSASEWNYLQNSSIAVGSPLNSYFRMAGNYIYIGPTPSSVRTIGYDYQSKYWISGKNEFTADADEPLIDDQLMILGLRWRFLQSKGDDYESVRGEYQSLLDALQAQDGGKSVISFAAPASNPYDGLPEGNFG